jgi:PEGA domain
MKTRAYALVLGAAIGMAMVAAPASAEEPGPNALPITVVALQTNDADDQAAALTRALKNAVRTLPGWSLGEGDYSLEVLTLTLKCSEPPDASCESRIADQIKADRYIWGTINKKGTDVEGELHLWVRGKGAKKGNVRYSANLTEANDEALKKVANDLLIQLTDGPPKGSVLVKAGNIGGQVFIDGEPVGALVAGSGTFPLSAGPHQVVVKAPGYADSEGTVTIRPNATAELVLTPVAEGKSAPINLRQVGGFVGLGAGVAFGVVGLVSALQVNSVQSDGQFELYQQQFSEPDDVCAKADENAPVTRMVTGAPDAGYIQDQCSKAQTFEIMQVVFFPLAAIAAGAGIYLLMTTPTGAPTTTGLTFRPQIGTDHGKLDVTFRW